MIVRAFMKAISSFLLASVLGMGALPAVADDCEERRQLAYKIGGLVGSLHIACVFLERGWVKEEFEGERLDAVRTALVRFSQLDDVSAETKRDVFEKFDNQVLRKCAGLVRENGIK